MDDKAPGWTIPDACWVRPGGGPHGCGVGGRSPRSWPLAPLCVWGVWVTDGGGAHGIVLVPCQLRQRLGWGVRVLGDIGTHALVVVMRQSRQSSVGGAWAIGGNPTCPVDAPSRSVHWAVSWFMSLCSRAGVFRLLALPAPTQSVVSNLVSDIGTHPGEGVIMGRSRQYLCWCTRVANNSAAHPRIVVIRQACQ